MSYPTYTLPSNAGITFSFGGGSQQPFPAAALCSKADAQMIQKSFGGTLVNAALTPSLGMTFINVSPTASAQPWYLTDLASPGFAGYLVAQQYAANNVNGGGVGNPGAWTGIGSNPRWVPTAPPVVVPPPATNAGDAAAFAHAMGVGDSPTLADIHRLMIALASKFGIS